jgi:uncharacterized SAM-binding protein YcdF (DUF218 family)
MLRQIGSLLIVEDSLRPAAAIVALGGQAPFREIEAAKLYHGGLAPQVVIVREAPSAESEALQRLGVKKVPQWELARAVLIQQGVPGQAIVIPEDDAVGTLEELQAVWGALQQGAWSREQGARGKRSEVRDQRSDGAEQGAGSVETEAGDQRSEVRSQRSAVSDESTHRTQETQLTQRTQNATVIRHPFSVASNATNTERNNAINAPMPVILVTSKYHTRRTRLTWQYVSGGQSQPIVRAASGDPFEPESWWKTRGYVLSVVREYLGLFNYWLGFPVGVGSN